MSITLDRLTTTVQRTLTELIQKEVKDPAVGFITVTDVEITNDLSYATVYVSFLGNEAREKAGMKALDRAKGFLRRELGRRVKMRKVPELIFKVDTSLKYGQHIDALLNKVKNEKQ